MRTQSGTLTGSLWAPLASIISRLRIAVCQESKDGSLRWNSLDSALHMR